MVGAFDRIQRACSLNGAWHIIISRRRYSGKIPRHYMQGPFSYIFLYGGVFSFQDKFIQ